MAKVKTKGNASELLDVVVNALHEKKGNNVVSLDLRKIKDTVANFFVIVHGDSSTHVNALHHTVVELTRNAGHPVYRVEGTTNAEWIIVDFVDVVVHIFHRDKRDFYQLEELWHDAPATRHSDEKPSGVKKRTRPEIDGKEYKDKYAEKFVARKAAAKKAVAGKKAAAKAPVKKAAVAKKTVEKEVPAKKVASKKPATKKPIAKKTATKKTK